MPNGSFAFAFRWSLHERAMVEGRPALLPLRFCKLALFVVWAFVARRRCHTTGKGVNAFADRREQQWQA
jgi:hypothetical protein